MAPGQGPTIKRDSVFEELFGGPLWSRADGGNFRSAKV